MRNSIGFVVVAAVLALGACGGGEQEGGVTAEESQQLNEAAEMLDASPDSLATDEASLGNGEVPAENAATGELPPTENAAADAQ